MPHVSCARAAVQAPDVRQKSCVLHKYMIVSDNMAQQE